MKILRLLAMAALIIGVCGIAKADPVDFTFQVLDPPSGPGYAVVQPGVPFPLEFVSCSPFSFLGDGCFLGFNDSKQFLTTLDFTFPDTTPLGGQPVTCLTVGSLFGTADCSLSGDVYTLDFSGGTGIAPYTFFLVTEDGVSADDFPVGAAVANATPEPSSIWMALSGTGALGYLLRRRRRMSIG